MEKIKKLDNANLKQKANKRVWCSNKEIKKTYYLTNQNPTFIGINWIASINTKINQLT